MLTLAGINISQIALGDNDNLLGNIGRTMQLLVQTMASGSTLLMSAAVKTTMTFLKS
jgi:hypothetical protein